jgi:hypothetical protein
MIFIVFSAIFFKAFLRNKIDPMHLIEVQSGKMYVFNGCYSSNINEDGKHRWTINGIGSTDFEWTIPYTVPLANKAS